MLQLARLINTNDLLARSLSLSFLFVLPTLSWIPLIVIVTHSISPVIDMIFERQRSRAML